ncbi:hypothetical protein [Lactococcus sp.]|uniref:hypothetical protein n=1 Tax=Lactococcus sp. TaxID=44273 RepID=UPI0035AEE4DC
MRTRKAVYLQLPFGVIAENICPFSLVAEATREKGFSDLQPMPLLFELQLITDKGQMVYAFIV